VSSTTINSTTGVFIQNISVTTTSSTQKILLLGGFEYLISTASYQLAATIGRGSGAPATNFINLANGISFATREIIVAVATGDQDNMSTSLSTQYTTDTSQGSSCSFTFVDTPGSVGTFTYAIRIVATASGNTLYLRQIYLNAIKVT